MALKPFVGPWPVLQFRNYIHGRIPWTGDQPITRPLPTYGTAQTQNKRMQYRHPCLKWNSNPRADEDSSWQSPRGHCDRLGQISGYGDFHCHRMWRNSVVMTQWYTSLSDDETASKMFETQHKNSDSLTGPIEAGGYRVEEGVLRSQ
jgi:hypothetical protein